MEVKSNAPLLVFGVEDITKLFESPHISGLQCFQTCLNQKLDYASQIDDTSTYD